MSTIPTLPTELLKPALLSRPWVRVAALIAAVIALATLAVYAPSCQSKRKSVLTGEPVPLEQAYEDLDTKRELDQAASERDAAKAAAAEIKDKAEAQAALEKASKEADRRTAKERREFARFAESTKADAELQIKQIEQEARAKITEASDKLEDAVSLSDEALAAQVAQIRKTTQDLIDARNEATEEKIRQRGEGLAAEKAAIDGQAKADAAKWAWVQSAFAVAKPILSALPGGGVAADGINTLLLLAGGGAGLAAIKKRSDAAKSQKERDEYAEMARELEQQRAENERKAKELASAVVKITDSFEVLKDKLPPGLWDQVKKDVKDWQGPQASQLVDLARTHVDPIKAL